MNDSGVHRAAEHADRCSCSSGLTTDGFPVAETGMKTKTSHTERRRLTMAGLQDPNVIDLVVRGPDDRPVLYIIEERPWGADETQGDQLMAKVNTYGTYVLGEQFREDYPDLAASEHMTIRLECATQPTPEVQQVIDAATDGLEKLNVAFETNVNPALLDEAQAT